MYKLSRKRLVSSSSDEDNYSLNVPTSNIHKLSIRNGFHDDLRMKTSLG